MTLLTVLSLKLQVTQAQIKKCLALAPVYKTSCESIQNVK